MEQETKEINGVHQKIDPIIICGTGRSGTSLVANIIRQAGVFLGYTFVPRNSSNPDGFWEDVEFLTLCGELHCSNCDLGNWYEELIPLIERRYQQASKTGQQWGFKAPVVLNLVEYFVSLFPNAKWLIPIRKREDVIASCVKTYGWSVEVAVQNHDTRIAMKHEFLSDQDVCEIKFELLIKEPEMQICRICEWANLEFSDKLVAIVQPERVHSHGSMGR